ncbi:glycosyltransferase family 2 protein [Paenibacillus glufosinatiresistens]|uniref:glycosyltransferase family 2 protein n=1 Tax=Paenibacillus glufosinatiresistens TaxID=3070657 RepID=UPI00286E9412|nr:glycosyltransferase [Paenibacillus sp. YX.27]
MKRAAARKTGRSGGSVQKGAQLRMLRADGGPSVSVIIPAMNEAGTIAAVIAAARSVAPGTEVIVVDNGSSDGTGKIAAAAGARVLNFPEPLGHDVGRRAGAREASGDILLFLDADMVIPAARLRPFVEAVAVGADVALNDYSGPVSRRQPHPIVLAKHGLNALLGRPDLKGCSLTAVPHALSRQAAERLGDLLAVPPAALARAVLDGLRVVRASHVPVGRLNPVRRRNAGRDPLQDVVFADHLVAMELLLRERGPRAGFTDGARRREMVR